MGQTLPMVISKGERGKAIRKALGLTQAKFAKRPGTNRNVIQGPKKDKRNPGATGHQ